MKSLEPGSLVLFGQQHSKTVPLNKNLTYLTGLDGETAILILYRTASGHGEILFLPNPSPHQVRWEGRPLAPGEAASRRTGIDRTFDLADLGSILQPIEPHVTEIYLWGDHLGKGKTVTALRQWIDARKRPPQSAARQLARLRLVKDDLEIAHIQRAIDITAAGLLETMASARPGMYEYELEAVIEYIAQRNGSLRMGFDSIVGSGPNSCILHYNTNRRKTEAGDLVLMDVGAEWAGYSADITRTIPISGTFTPRQREIYEAVLAAQKAAIEQCVVGNTLRKIHATARAVLAEKGLAKHYFHGTSHWLGLDVHDVGNYMTPLKPGMVLTVEPGVYIDAENLGIRIEDDILVTEKGPIVLSRKIPRSVEAIEAWMKRDGIGTQRRKFEPQPK
jgi:Xaa-Pro aminopeptidase